MLGTPSRPNTAAGIDVRFLAQLAKWVDRIVALRSVDARAAADIGAAPFAVERPYLSNLLAWSIPNSRATHRRVSACPLGPIRRVPQAMRRAPYAACTAGSCKAGDSAN
ncbi:hypothetical protein JCM19992_32030 [Thermostilla marina]